MLAGAPPGFLLGAATSAYQIEGGNHNDWTAWEKGRYPDGTPHVADGTNASRAADSWNLWRSDLAALQLLGANVYRMGIEWSRLEPAEGVWDEAAAARYREMFAALRAAHISPMVTLYHFTLPTWVAARGGWEWAGAPAALAAFAGRAGAAFGDLVDWWCTINEPNVLVAKSYLAAQWPPGVRDPRRAALVLAALMRAHGLMAGALRADRPRSTPTATGTRRGSGSPRTCASSTRIRPTRSTRWSPGAADGFYDESFLDAVTLGRVRVVLPRVIDIDEPFPPLAGSLDFLGINYYTRDLVVGALSGPNVYTPAAVPDHPRNDLGWEVYPEGLYRAAAPLCPTRVAARRDRDRGGGRARRPAQRLPARPPLRRRPRPRRGGRRRRLHLLVAHRQLRVVARDARPLRALLDRLRRPGSDPPADLGGRHFSGGGAESRHAAIGPAQAPEACLTGAFRYGCVQRVPVYTRWVPAYLLPYCREVRASLMKHLSPLLLLVSAGLVLGCAGVKQAASPRRVRGVAPVRRPGAAAAAGAAAPPPTRAAMALATILAAVPSALTGPAAPFRRARRGSSRNGGSGSGGPCLFEPQDGTLLPNNWLRPRFSWTATGDLYELRVSGANQADDLVVYTDKTSWTMPAAMWRALAIDSQDMPLTVTISSSSHGGRALDRDVGRLLDRARRRLGEPGLLVPVGLDERRHRPGGQHGALRHLGRRRKRHPGPGADRRRQERDVENDGRRVQQTPRHLHRLPHLHAGRQLHRLQRRLSLGRCPGLGTAGPDGRFAPSFDVPSIGAGGYNAFIQPWVGITTFSINHWAANDYIAVAPLGTCGNGAPCSSGSSIDGDQQPGLAWFDLVELVQLHGDGRSGHHAQGDGLELDLPARHDEQEVRGRALLEPPAQRRFHRLHDDQQREVGTTRNRHRAPLQGPLFEDGGSDPDGDSG